MAESHHFHSLIKPQLGLTYSKYEIGKSWSMLCHGKGTELGARGTAQGQVSQLNLLHDLTSLMSKDYASQSS